MCLKLVHLTVVQIFYSNMRYVIGGPISTIVRGVSIGLDGDAICHILDCGPSPNPPNRRDSFLKEKKEMKKLLFSSFEKPASGEERCCLELPLTFYFCF